MRKLIALLFTIIFITDSSFAQIEADISSIDINDYYQDVENRVLYTKVITADSLSQKEIIQLVKNWAAINFRNLRYTLVGETENQLVVRYIQEGFYTNALIKTSAPWNILLIVQVKDGKLRYQFKDEGNAYSSPGLFAARVTNDREYYLSSFFNSKKKPGYATGKIIVPGLKNIHSIIEKTTISLEKYILQGKSQEDNW
jgi:hypothetical protein